MLTEHRLPLYLPQSCFQLLLCWGLEYCDILHIYINSHFMFLLVNLTTKRARRFCGHKQPMLMNCWIKKRMQVVFRELLKGQAFHPKSVGHPSNPCLEGRRAASSGGQLWRLDCFLQPGCYSPLVRKQRLSPGWPRGSLLEVCTNSGRAALPPGCPEPLAAVLCLDVKWSMGWGAVTDARTREARGSSPFHSPWPVTDADLQRLASCTLNPGGGCSGCLDPPPMGLGSCPPADATSSRVAFPSSPLGATLVLGEQDVMPCPHARCPGDVPTGMALPV